MNFDDLGLGDQPELKGVIYPTKRYKQPPKKKRVKPPYLLPLGKGSRGPYAKCHPESGVKEKTPKTVLPVKINEGRCACSNLAFRKKQGSWTCPRCLDIERRAKSSEDIRERVAAFGDTPDYYSMPSRRKA